VGLKSRRRKLGITALRKRKLFEPAGKVMLSTDRRRPHAYRVEANGQYTKLSDREAIEITEARRAEDAAAGDIADRFKREVVAPAIGEVQGDQYF
jgi:hypothetical protein